MTEISRPWNGTVTGDAGPYSDTDWQELYQAIIGWGGSRANNGVFLMSGTEPDDGLKVTAPGTTDIDVAPGAALIQGIAYISDATESFTIAANGTGNPRIDTLVLQADYALQTVRLTVLPGTAAVSPVAPSLTQSAGVMWEIPIVDIAVANGFVTITQADISPRQNWVNAPPAVYLDHILNNSGAALNQGQVVIWDTAADRAVTTTTTRDHKKVAGVWVGQTASAEYGRILTKGIGYVKTDAAVTRGDILTTSTTAGSATKPVTSGAATNAVIGRALETTAGAGLCLTEVEVHIVNDFDYVLVQDQKTSGTGGGSTVASAWTTRTLNTEVTDTGSIASLASNKITLPAGIYTASWISAFGANVTGARTRLRDVTNNATLGQAVNTNNVNTSSGHCRFVLTGSTDIELQYWANTAAANGLGLATTTGEVEVYSSVEIFRHGETS